MDEKDHYFITGPTENEREELKKCMESPAYFFNKYVELRDKDGNVLPKREITDEELAEAHRAEVVRRSRRFPYHIDFERRLRFLQTLYGHLKSEKILIARP